MSIAALLTRVCVDYERENARLPDVIVMPAHETTYIALMQQFLATMRYTYEATRSISTNTPIQWMGIDVAWGPVAEPIACSGVFAGNKVLPPSPLLASATPGDRQRALREIGAAVRQWCPEAADYLESYTEGT